MSYLVDANVLCEATRPQAAASVLTWLAANDDQLQVSVITLGEIMKGIRLRPRSRRRTQLDRWFTELQRSFAGRVLEVDLETMEVWADLYSRHQRTGRLLSSFDSLLAATALQHGLTVATRNLGDFPLEIPLLNPWETIAGR